MEGPMTMLHANVYSVGATVSFLGDKAYLIVSCGTTTLTIAEPLSEWNSGTFAQALMQVMMHFGIAYTLVLD